MTARYFQQPPQTIPSLDVLTDVLLFEVVNHFKMVPGSALYGLLNWLGKPPARRFAEIMQRFDAMIAQNSLWQAAKEILLEFSAGISLTGQEVIPQSGPVLVVANHPGGADSIAALASVARNDEHLLVMERPMLIAMPNFSRHMIYLDEENPLRIDVMRSVIKKLSNGECVILFPRGNLEPDPPLYPGAIDTIQEWSNSIGLFLSKVPETILQPLLISNVVSPRAWKSCLARSARTTKTRHQVAMLFQVAMQRLFPGGNWKIPVKVKAVPGVSARELAPSLEVGELNAAVKACVREQMREEYQR